MTRRPRPAPIAVTHTVSWTPTALAQLTAIEAFLAEDPSYAADVSVEIRRVAARLELFPGRGTPIEDDVYFRVVLDRYILRYEFDDANVVILGVRDGRRR